MWRRTAIFIFRQRLAGQNNRFEVRGKLGLTAGYAGKNIEIPWPLIKKAEELGYDSVWTAEAYGSDAVTPAAPPPTSAADRRAVWATISTRLRP
jgi:hypothetical protein